MAENLTIENFKEKVSEGRWVVDFWAPWCGPCKLQAEIFAKVADNIEKNKVKIGKVNNDKQPDLARFFNIRGIPTLVFVDNGNIKDVNIGVLSEKALIEKMRNVFGD